MVMIRKKLLSTRWSKPTLPTLVVLLLLSQSVHAPFFLMRLANQATEPLQGEAVAGADSSDAVVPEARTSSLDGQIVDGAGHLSLASDLTSPLLDGTTSIGINGTSFLVSLDDSGIESATYPATSGSGSGTSGTVDVGASGGGISSTDDANSPPANNDTTVGESAGATNQPSDEASSSSPTNDKTLVGSTGASNQPSDGTSSSNPTDTVPLAGPQTSASADDCSPYTTKDTPLDASGPVDSSGSADVCGTQESIQNVADSLRVAEGTSSSNDEPATSMAGSPVEDVPTIAAAGSPLAEYLDDPNQYPEVLMAALPEETYPDLLALRRTVPEPSTLLLLGLGFACLWLGRPGVRFGNIKLSTT